MLADKIGRRPVLVGATLWFSAMTIATGYAQNMEQLLWLRFIGGIPMGCIIPNATALIGEFSPKGRKVTLMMCITVGFTGGAMLAGARLALADPGVRLAIDVHLRRRDAARHRRADGLGPAGIAAVPRRQEDAPRSAGPLAAAARSRASRSITRDAVRRQRGQPRRRTDRAPLPRGPRSDDAAAVGRELHEHPDPLLAVQLAADGRHRHGLHPADGDSGRHGHAGGRHDRDVRPGVADRARADSCRRWR